MNIAEVALVFVLTLPAVFDIAAQYIRGNVAIKKRSELIAVGNWIQYQARIFTMLSVVWLSLMFERKKLNLEIDEIFIVSTIASAVVGIVYVRNRKIFDALNRAMLLPSKIFFKDVERDDYYFPITFRFGAPFFFSLIYNVLIYMAIIVPFWAASLRPDLRMTLAYSGQVLNFAGSIINLTTIEPRFFRAMDSNSEGDVISQLIYAKLASAFVVLAIVLVA